MDNTRLLITAMAEGCRNWIQEWCQKVPGLPIPLQPQHLAWMCNQIEENADDWPSTRLHRWIGFVQCGMMANGMLDLDGAKAMFDKAKVAYGEVSEDLTDHLDSASSFEVDIGGES